MDRTTVLMKWISIYLCLLQCCFCARHILKDPKVHFSNAGDTMGNNNNPELKMYCLNAALTSKYLAHMWRTMTMHLDTNPDSYILYDDKTSEKIHPKHNENQKSWSFNLFDTKIQLEINSFEDICIGVYIESFNESGYITNLTETCTNVWKLTMMIIGIIIFWYAYILSRNSFYYICGIIFMITLPITFLIYNMARSLILRGKVMCLVFAALMSKLYLPQLWESTHLSVVQYREWIMWYILVIPLISCVICYRCGSVINKRIKQIIQWFLQLMRLTRVYRSNYFYAASCFSCCIILLYTFRKALERGKRYWQTVFPEKRKLLSEDQYYQEGIQNTRKSLKELQNYCSSPECNPWKIVLRLKDPIRFAKFMEGEPHLSKYEIEEHEEEISKILKEDEYTDDDDKY